MRTAQHYQRYYGLYLAQVLDVDDPEKLGRVRVHAEQYEDSNDDPVWATVARPAAGDKTGVFFTPKVGDQVVIAYVVGDVHGPLIVGYAHSQKRPAPGETSTTTHGIVTTIGSVTFDEKGGRIEVSFTGSPSSPSKVVMDATGVTILATNINLVGQVNVLGNISASPAAGGVPSFPDAPGLPNPSTDGVLHMKANEVKFDVQPTLAGDPKFCVNEQGVVRAGFLDQVFAVHVHPAGTPTTGMPVPIPAPDQKTDC